MIRGNRITLRAVTRDLYHQFYRWRQDPEVMFWGTGEPNMTTIIPEDRFMANYEDIIRDPLRQGLFGIFIDEDTPIGMVDYRDLDPINRTAVVGITIGVKDRWGQGYGTDALATLCRLLFERFGLRRIQADTWDGNHRSLAMMQKIGFQIEGRLRHAECVRGVPTDSIVLGLLSDELVYPSLLTD